MYWPGGFMWETGASATRHHRPSARVLQREALPALADLGAECPVGGWALAR
jgi:hypothetical protein